MGTFKRKNIVLYLFLDSLAKLLSTERVSRRIDRSEAVFEDGKIKILKRRGKWGPIGTPNYLQPHEACFLMEIVCGFSITNSKTNFIYSQNNISI